MLLLSLQLPSWFNFLPFRCWCIFRRLLSLASGECSEHNRQMESCRADAFTLGERLRLRVQVFRFEHTTRIPKSEQSCRTEFNSATWLSNNMPVHPGRLVYLSLIRSKARPANQVTAVIPTPSLGSFSRTSLRLANRMLLSAILPRRFSDCEWVHTSKAFSVEHFHNNKSVIAFSLYDSADAALHMCSEVL